MLANGAIRSLTKQLHRVSLTSPTSCRQISFSPYIRKDVFVPPPPSSINHTIELPTRFPKQTIMDQLIPKPELRTPSRLLPLVQELTYDLPTTRIGDQISYEAAKKFRVFYPHKPKSIMRIRREKMNKHRLKKFRKKYMALIKKTRLRREIKKEKLFRAELLAQIKEAEQFDAEKYVKTVLGTIDKIPKPETLYERKRRYMALQRIHRANTTLVPPLFEDPVP